MPTWTAPRTYSTGELVTATILNTDHRDNLLVLVHPHTISSTDIDVASSIAETSIGSFTVLANTLGSQGLLVVRYVGDYLHNNAAGDNLTVKVKFGASTIFNDSVSFNAETSANRQPWELLFNLENRAATNSQLLTGNWWALSPARSAPTTGIGDMSLNFATNTSPIQSTSSIDTTVNQTFDVTVQWTASSANNSFRRRSMRVGLQQY